ncbi:MAG: RNA polymerase sigma factor [Thermomicrobiales bacterium]
MTNSEAKLNSVPGAEHRPTRPLYSLEDQARDVALMARVANGDRDALGELYDQHASQVLGLMMPILRDRRIAEETLQDLFLNLWQRPHTYDSQRGAFVGWLLRVARNRSIDVLRKQRERRFADFTTGADDGPLDPGAWLVDPDPDPSDQAVTSDLGARVRAALSTLSREQRETLELAYFGGLSHREIADQLKRPLGTVKTQIRSGMQRMAHLLSGMGLEHVE